MKAPFFDGEFRNVYEKGNNDVYVFKGNKWSWTSNDKSKDVSGTFELTGREIIFYNEKGKKWWNVQYGIDDLLFQTVTKDNTATYLKQPVEAFANSGKLVTQFQGTWTNSNNPNVSYTFSGNKFVFTNSKNTVEGTIEANSRIIKLTAPDGYAMMTYEFKDGKLYFGWIMSTVNKEWWYGPFDLKK